MRGRDRVSVVGIRGGASRCTRRSRASPRAPRWPSSWARTRRRRRQPRRHRDADDATAPSQGPSRRGHQPEPARPRDLMSASAAICVAALVVGTVGAMALTQRLRRRGRSRASIAAQDEADARYRVCLSPPATTPSTSRWSTPRSESCAAARPRGAPRRRGAGALLRWDGRRRRRASRSRRASTGCACSSRRSTARSISGERFKIPRTASEAAEGPDRGALSAAACGAAAGARAPRCSSAPADAAALLAPSRSGWPWRSRRRGLGRARVARGTGRPRSRRSSCFGGGRAVRARDVAAQRPLPLAARSSSPRCRSGSRSSQAATRSTSWCRSTR